MFPTRGQLEVFVVAWVAAALTALFLTRTLTVADHSQKQALESAAAAFVAGVEMLQAESRLGDRRPLNAMGYPTGRSGALRDDSDCELIWHETTQNAALVAQFVADTHGGDRCEYRLDGTAESTARILYWPLGADTASVESSHGLTRVVRGTHVQVDAGDLSS
ncbi:MAG TPA: hypothetical protein VFG38_14325 [Pseudomonadales bacterium]|nr:hypothetical protein [Pseudomonadales bacterium]